MDFEKIKEIFEKIVNATPFIRVLPWIYKAWDNLPDEKKQEYAEIFLAAAAKAASQYAKS